MMAAVFREEELSVLPSLAILGFTQSVCSLSVVRWSTYEVRFSLYDVRFMSLLGCTYAALPNI
uniref:Uncharacterized protein n=1 Tax=Picea glauca TaxID=3330 RepID=A0A101LUY7_PICGL|nr:hypothetical protein ABT39_MTgene2181 [Picea glauca]QHR88056.1 hypothetical protein Q903MT_gene2068 [Picea sitchensis]